MPSLAAVPAPKAAASPPARCTEPDRAASIVRPVTDGIPLGYPPSEVDLLVHVDRNGKLLSVRYLHRSGNIGLDDSVEKQARMSGYAPARKHCRTAPGDVPFQAIIEGPG